MTELNDMEKYALRYVLEMQEQYILFDDINEEELEIATKESFKGNLTNIINSLILQEVEATIARKRYSNLKANKEKSDAFISKDRIKELIKLKKEECGIVEDDNVLDFVEEKILKDEQMKDDITSMLNTKMYDLIDAYYLNEETKKKQRLEGREEISQNSKEPIDIYSVKEIVNDKKKNGKTTEEITKELMDAINKIFG